MVAALTRVFGVHNLALAEDVVQDAFCRALEVWRFRGVPDNPSAWLMATAKNRAIDVLRRERTARTFAPELGRLLESEWTLVPDGRGAVRSARGQRRPAAHDVFVLPSPAARGGAGRARPPHPVRLQRRRGRGGVSQHRGRDPEADLAGEEGAVGIEAAVRPGGRRVLRAAVSGPSSALSALQRGLPRRFAESAVRVELCREAMRLARAARRPSARRNARDARARGAHVPARGAPAGARRCGRGAQLARSIRIGRSGIARLIAEGQRLLELSADRSGADRVSRRGGDRVGPRARPAGGRHGLGTDRRALRHADDDPPVAGRRAQSGDRRCAAEGPERGLEEIRAIADRDRLRGYPFYFAALGELELSLRPAAISPAKHFQRRARAGAQPDGTAIPRAARERMRGSVGPFLPFLPFQRICPACPSCPVLPFLPCPVVARLG